MMVPVILALKKEYPNLRISVLTRAQFAPIFKRIDGVSAEGVDLKSEYTGFLGLIRLAVKIKRGNYGALADLHNVLRTTVITAFLGHTGIRVKKLDKGRSQRKQLTRIQKKVFKPIKPTITRYAEVLEKLGYPLSPNSYSTLEPAGPGAIPETWNPGRGVVKIGLAPFAAHQGKQYPLGQMEQVIALLTREKNIALFLLGSPAESVVLEQWAKTYPGTTNTAGKESFETELNLISQLDLLIGMDSGNGHLAAMFGVPVLTIWGVTHPYAGFAPYGQAEEHWLLPDRDQFPAIPTSIYGDSYPRGYEAAIATITPQQVVNKALKILEK